MKKYYHPIFIVFAILMGCMIGYAVSHFSLQKNLPTNKNLAMLPLTETSSANSSIKLYQTLQLLNHAYVDSINSDSIVEEMMLNIIHQLDPHSAYIPAKDLDMVNSELSGSFSGVGIQFSIQNDTIQIVAVIAGGPSAKTGLIAGDKIVQVNDSSFVGKKINNELVMHTLRGEKGTKVKLGIKRQGEPNLLTYTIIRDDVPLHSIEAKFIIERNEIKLGFIGINKFSETTYEEFITALNELKQKGAIGYIIDLRENAGGFMEQAIQMANEFLNKGDIIVSAQGHNYPRFEAKATSSGRFKKNPLVVLIDDFSASASEIFAGALQDNDRALIIGRRSFGKGLVQQQIPFQDGSAIRLTVARYYTPSGRCIQKPYKIGQAEEYNEELWERYTHGEFFNEDSISFSDSTKYYTKNGRIVMGGGGIMPDIFVPRDTSMYSTWFNKVVNYAYTYQFALDYTNKNRTTLSQFHNYTEMENYLKKSTCFSEFVVFCNEKGIPPVNDQITKSKPIAQRLIYSYIVRNMLGDKEFYPLFERDDNITQKATEILIEQINNQK